MNLISNYLLYNGEHGLYVTLEESVESIVRNINSFGFKKADNLHMFDYKDIRNEWKGKELDMVDLTENVIDFYREKCDNLSIFALDSLNALYSFTNHVNLRKDMYNFFTLLKDQELTSFLIMENSPNALFYDADRMGWAEHFLSDGVIMVGIEEVNDRVRRYIQVKKMRATKHKMEKHQIVVNDCGISVLGPLY
jgi:KaiC/GvpD/RAD55 family RecA-like ATPase